MNPSTWVSLLTDFRTYQLAAGLAEGTIRLYRYRLEDLAALVRRPQSVTTDHLLALLANPAWGAQTRKGTRTTYRAFFSWACRTGRLDHNPAELLPTIKVPAAPPRPAPEKVVRASLREADERELFMVLLGAYAGLRCCEIARVEASHWDGYELTVVGKGGRTRLVPITQRDLVDRLDQLVGVAFPNRYTGRPLTANHVSKLLSRTLDETWTGHTLRHRFATTTLDGTTDLLAVSEILGHSQVDTTRRYCLTSAARRRAVADAAA